MKNYITMLLNLLVFNFISYNLGLVIFFTSLIPTLFVTLTAFNILNFKAEKFTYFKNLLQMESKVLQYIKWDYLNGPIYYIIVSLIWITCTVYLVQDFRECGEVSFDIPIMFFSIYLVTLVMIFNGYIREYSKLK